MSAHLYIEGGESKEDQIRCREGFRRLLEKAGFTGRLPRLSACGGRNSAFDYFKTARAHRKAGHFVAMLIDSEDPVVDIEKTWQHLKTGDNWERPAATSDDEVLFMTTCMESWIVADRETLKKHYGHKLHESALPPPIISSTEVAPRSMTSWCMPHAIAPMPIERETDRSQSLAN